MTISIKYVTLGLAATNAYLVGDEETHEAILIDPVDEADVLMKMAEEAGWTIKLILATHAHFDHILASKALKEMTGAPFYLHSDAAERLKELPETGLRFTGSKFPEAATPDRLLTTEPETIELGLIRLETLYSPGHAPGHLAFYMRDQDVVFSGDALFAGSIGRTDLPGGDHARLLKSIREQLLTLPDETTVLAGHGGVTTIGQERKTNPFLS
jgi:hydroxyacylglutathione hydrolase